MGRIKNMGTATMQFKEGIYVTGSAHNPDGTDSSYSLVVSGTIGVQNLIERIGDPDTAIIFENDKIFLDATDVIVGTETTAGSHPLTVSGSMNLLGDPTATSSVTPHDGTETLDRTKWYYLTGIDDDSIESTSVANTAYQPRNLKNTISVVSSSYTGNETSFNTSNTSISFKGVGGGSRTRLFSYKETFSGDVTVVFYLVAGASGTGAARVEDPQGASDLAANVNGWGSPSSSEATNFPVKLVYATDGFDINATWNTVESIYAYKNQHPYGDGNANDPDANQDNFDTDGFYAYRFTITGVSGQYYVGLKQDVGTLDADSRQHAWAMTGFAITSDSDAKNGYINFTTGSTTVEGVDGYGFRIDQSSGDMQFRDSTGDASWVDFKSFAVGGSDGQVQYNNGGVLGGASNLFYDDVNNRVGIGTTSPDELLHVSGSSTTTVLIGEGSAGGTTRIAQLKLAADSGNTTVTGSMVVDSPGGGLNHFMAIGTDSNHNLRIRSNNTTRILVSGSGQVGIGSFTSNTLDEDFNLHIQQDESLGAGVLLSRKDSSIANAERLGSVFFGGTTDGVNFDYGALIESRTEGTWTPGSDTPANIKFWTTDDGSSTAIQRMMIRHNGNVGIGDALVPANHKLEVAGDIGINEKLVHRGDTDTYLSFASNDVRISAGGSETLTVLNSGVGIGLTSPQAELHIEASNDDADIVLSRNDSNIQEGDVLGTVHFAGTENGSNWGYGARISAIASDDWSVGSDIPTRLEFYTTNDGAGSATQKMVIADDGNVGIGTSFTSDAKLTVTGSVLINGFSQNTSPTLMFQNDDVNLISNAVLGELTFSGFGDPTVNEAAKIRVNADGPYRAYQKSRMTFLTADGNGQPPTEVMRLEDQSVMIGTPTSSHVAGYNLGISGSMIVRRVSNGLNNGTIVTDRIDLREIYGHPDQTATQLMLKFDDTTGSPALRFNPNAGTIDLKVMSGFNDVALHSDSSVTHGQILIGCDGQDGGPEYSNYLVNDASGLYVEGEQSTKAVATIVNRSTDTTSDGLAIIIGKGQYFDSGAHHDEAGNDNSFIVFYDKDRGNSVSANPDDVEQVGYIAGDGTGGITVQDSFTGAHDTVTEYPNNPGLIIEATGDMWIDASISNATCALPKSRLCSTAKSKSVFGVVRCNELRNGRAKKVPEGWTGVVANAIGEGKVWVTNIGGNIENGDYITSSNIAGYGMLQEDDILHNYTVAKCTQAVNWSTITDTIDHEGVTYKKYLIACTYHCG